MIPTFSHRVSSASRAEEPVPQGERSQRPGETTTVFRAISWGGRPDCTELHGSGLYAMLTPAAAVTRN
jgi:hypothetical protein